MIRDEWFKAAALRASEPAGEILNGVKDLEKSWSTGRELNPRILVLQTSALATSPPVLEKQTTEQKLVYSLPQAALCAEPRSPPVSSLFSAMKNPPRRQAGGSSGSIPFGTQLTPTPRAPLR